MARRRTLSSAMHTVAIAQMGHTDINAMAVFMTCSLGAGKRQPSLALYALRQPRRMNWGRAARPSAFAPPSCAPVVYDWEGFSHDCKLSAAQRKALAGSAQP